MRSQYTANLWAAQEREYAANAAFFEAMTVPWWMPWKSSRLLDEALRLRTESLRLREENVALAVVIEGAS